VYSGPLQLEDDGLAEDDGLDERESNKKRKFIREENFHYVR
jgi:hypothetical protein